MRKGISLKMDELSKAITTDPDAGRQADLVTCSRPTSRRAPQVDDLFGWQLAAINPDGIKKTFDLYDEANGLKIDLGYLAGFVNGNVKALARAARACSRSSSRAGRGPRRAPRADVRRPQGRPTPCAEGKDEPVGFNIRDDPAAPRRTPRSAATTARSSLLIPDGSSTATSSALNPENNAKIVVGSSARPHQGAPRGDGQGRDSRPQGPQEVLG
jgi:hypothetical protein